ncbi:MAG: lactate racemase domain-containing protein [Trueperaceae bacterium]
MLTSVTSPPGALLSQEDIREALAGALGGRHGGEKMLVLIPDHTRTLPLPMLFRVLVEVLAHAAKIDFMVALGTHPPLSQERLLKLVGLSEEERAGRYRHVGLMNHDWGDPATLVPVGTLGRDRVQQIAGDRWHPTLGGDVEVRINRAALEYDHIIILGPTFPHEVVGFSGGAKYLFPGISGPEMINVTHWLGALAGVRGTIGIKNTPVRAMIHAAAELVPTPVTLAALVVEGEGLAGLFVGAHLEAWSAAADLSAKRHIRWFDRPFERVLSGAPPMYDELWTAGKAMYKLEPALAAGGELIIYAPHLDTVSRVHGRYIWEIGYHVLEYFLAQWKRFEQIPLGVLAHSTHVRGDGAFEDGVERPRAKVTLATRLSREECDRLNLGYLDPAGIDPQSWKGREGEGILYVPKAGEMLYRVRGSG